MQWGFSQIQIKCFFGYFNPIDIIFCLKKWIIFIVGRVWQNRGKKRPAYVRKKKPVRVPYVQNRRKSTTKTPEKPIPYVRDIKHTRTLPYGVRAMANYDIFRGDHELIFWLEKLRWCGVSTFQLSPETGYCSHGQGELFRYYTQKNR